MTMSALSQEPHAESVALFHCIDLDALNEPHELSEWISILPQYKPHNNRNDEDIKNCQSLSKFMYQSQLCGHHIKYNFDESNFKDILNHIHGANDFNYSEYEWIWHIIKHSQQSNTDNKNSNKLDWIDSTWNRFQIVQQHELQTNTLKKQIVPNDVHKHVQSDKIEEDEDDDFIDGSDEMFANLTSMILLANPKANELIIDDPKTAHIEPVTSQNSEIANNLELYSTDDEQNTPRALSKLHNKSRSTKTVRFKPPIYYDRFDSGDSEHQSSSALDLMILYVDVMSDWNEYSPSPKPYNDRRVGTPLTPTESAWESYDVDGLLEQIEQSEKKKEDEVQTPPSLRPHNTEPIIKKSKSVWDAFDIEALLKDMSGDDEEEDEEKKEDDVVQKEKEKEKENRRRLFSKHTHQSHSTTSLRLRSLQLPTFKRSGVSNMFKHFNIHHYHGLTKY